MRTPLYTMKVLSKYGTTIRIRVRAACDKAPLTYSRLFALAVLYEPLAMDHVDGPLRAVFDAATIIDWSSSGVPWSREPQLEHVIRDVGYEDLSDDCRAATIKIDAGHPRWLAHLEPGMAWESHVWDSHGPSVSLKAS
jgi:hypothetical protein